MYLKDLAQLIANHLLEEGETKALCYRTIIKGKQYNLMYVYVQDTPYTKRLIYKLNIDKLKPTKSSPSQTQLPDAIKDLFEDNYVMGEITAILSRKEPSVFP